MPLKTQLDEQPALNLTPMIDVVFLLIIFFMVGTKFAELERNIALQMPQVQDPGTLTGPPPARQIAVYPQGLITLDSQEVTLEELTLRLAELKSQNPSLRVQVRGDRAASVQQVAEVFSACRLAGVEGLGLSVEVARTADRR